MQQPPPIPSAAPPQLTADHFRQIAEARTGWRRVRRAVGVARFDGWSVGTFGALTAVFSITSPSGLLLGLGMVVVGAVELWSATRLSRLDPKAARVLGVNQLAVALMLIAYAAWRIYVTRTGPSEYAALLGDDRELAGMLGSVEDMSREITTYVYYALILFAVVCQGSLALYYFTRGRHVRAYLVQTPPWIADMQRAGVVV